MSVPGHRDSSACESWSLGIWGPDLAGGMRTVHTFSPSGSPRALQAHANAASPHALELISEEHGAVSSARLALAPGRGGACVEVRVEVCAHAHV